MALGLAIDDDSIRMPMTLNGKASGEIDAAGSNVIAPAGERSHPPPPSAA